MQVRKKREGRSHGTFSLDIDTRRQDHARLGRALPPGAALYARGRTRFEEGKPLGLMATPAPFSKLSPAKVAASRDFAVRRRNGWSAQG
jgi:hypothetical protein